MQRGGLPDDAVVFDCPDYDDALIGVTTDGRAVYDYWKMVEVDAARNGITLEEAAELIDYTAIVSLGYAGENAPVVVVLDDDAEDDDADPEES